VKSRGFLIVLTSFNFEMPGSLDNRIKHHHGEKMAMISFFSGGNMRLS
jgi:hypothetical protein